MHMPQPLFVTPFVIAYVLYSCRRQEIMIVQSIALMRFIVCFDLDYMRICVFQARIFNGNAFVYTLLSLLWHLRYYNFNYTRRHAI